MTMKCAEFLKHLPITIAITLQLIILWNVEIGESFFNMASERNVGKLEEEALKRKERLKALRNKPQDTSDEPAEKKTADESSVLPR